MKFQCEACGFLGEAAGIKPMGAGLGLSCAECGATTELRVGEPPSPAPPAPPPTGEPPASALEPFAPVKAVRAPVAEVLGHAEPHAGPDPVEVLRRQGLKVEVGEGPVRCPKCGFRQKSPQPCARCGLDLRKPLPKTPPWEAIPEGKEPAVQELERRWEALVAGDFLSAQARDALIAFATQEQLLDRAARRFRFHAQDHAGTPVGDAAATSLAKIVERMHAAFVVAGQGSERGDYEAGVKRFKAGLYAIVAVMCIIVIALAVLLFGGKAEDRPQPREKPGRTR